MTIGIRRGMRPGWSSVLLACLAAIALLAGCGGGGGGGSTGGGGVTPATVTVTGTLKDTTTGILLANRTVTVQGTALTGVTNAQGQFSIAGVPATTITLVIKDSVGSVDGTIPVNVAS
ncbi:MAG: carboxypeptidase-like regulatory domain-containing protein, partial [Armatimonadota bacterium]|nr:carboxypeptidase-like regulatory domain-containing protein [Armatimonadota bacterium]